MSWTAGTPTSKQKRIATIAYRTNESTIPSIDEVFCKFTKPDDGKLTRAVVDKVYFESFPSGDASKTLSALCMNNRNIDGMRQSGTLGVVIEMLRHVQLGDNTSMTHIADLVRTINILSEDIMVQQRLLSNPHAIPNILRLCKFTTGSIQAQLFQIIDRLCHSTSGIDSILEYDIFDLLLSPEMLSRPSTLIEVRHGAALFASRIATYKPNKLPVSKIETVCIENGNRIVDGYIEIQLLNAMLAHLTWLSAEKHFLSVGQEFFVHLISEIKFETFEDLIHVRVTLYPTKM